MIGNDLRQEPGPPLGLVDPVLKKARGRDVVVMLAELMGGTHLASEMLVVVTKLGQHVLGLEEVGVVVFQALVLGDIADRMDRRSANLARSLGDIVGHREDLGCVLIEEQVVVAKML